MSAATTTLDAETLAAYRKHGAVVLRGVFTGWVDALRDGVDFNFAHPSPDGKIYQGDEGKGRFLSDYCNWRRIPAYRDFIFNSPAAALAGQLMDSRRVQLFHEHVLIKEAATAVPTPWHQDAPYYCVAGPKTVSLWVPLDPVPRDRSLEFIAGSHLWDKRFQPQRFNGQALNDGDGLEGVPDIEGDRDRYDILGWAVEPGDAIAFDFRTVHGAPANTSKTAMRRAFSLRLVGDDIRFVRQEGIVTSPPFREVTLADGAPLEGEAFPVLIGG
ncbi:MAG: phytanoyl-CoA dioxygenase family protein [Alphaproteobacteria bacterium]|nr:phytanoyl-CoA dioxygenase family protein [Alphaproteobacteria bacterium]